MTEISYHANQKLDMVKPKNRSLARKFYRRQAVARRSYKPGTLGANPHNQKDNE